MKLRINVVFLIVSTISSLSVLGSSENNVVYSASKCALNSMDGSLTWFSGKESWDDNNIPSSVYSSYGLHNKSSDKFFSVNCPIVNLAPEIVSPVSVEVRFKNSDKFREGTETLNHYYGDGYYVWWPVGCRLNSRTSDRKYSKKSQFVSFAGLTGGTSKQLPSLTQNTDSTYGISCYMGPDSKIFNYVVSQ
ncbi:hypothetical protein [Aliiglaciecola sp. M165]|uniref:hypothetical protein n=1 Tax=Aliiglaciecola sp. M165 TaxID=2593649 RepID=UPI00117C2FCA|nr:hypothetical protein [Aliiglaciecola sp. M165]TRY31411.1 hypothetical protein FM019_11085 [Aliiglaciecola sp. M165]